MFGFMRRGRNITKIALTPPQPALDRQGIAVVLIVRNEAQHIAEWASFHLLAGVRHFFVYNDGCTDGTIDILHQTLGHQVTVLPWHQKLRDGVSGREIHNQVLAYAHATRNFGADFRWFSYIDVDEFLIPCQDSDLNAALEPLSHCRNISLPWHMFGRSGHIEPPENGVLRNYTRRNPDPMSSAKGLKNFKMIVDPCHVTAIKVHSIEVDGRTDSCNDAGQHFTLRQRNTRAFYTAGRIQLNHYYTRSDSELRTKIARGPNLTTAQTDHLRRVLRKVENIEAGEIEDHRALAYLARKGNTEWP